jgi:exonuclease SbcC
MEINVKPKSLKLQGFAGIFAAFGRDELCLDLRTIPAAAKLVAFIGPIGAGKTTILDNLHPYRLMPSRSTTLGPGGFSYWDQIKGPTALKELEWEHDGIDYRTELSFRVAGKTRKADCYLYQFHPEAKEWKPVVLPDGTVSDSKADTYDRCVEEILGPPERFFTAQFSAQKRKSIVQYQVGDIKSILASVLNLEDFRSLSLQAGHVARFVKQRLDALNGDLAEARRHDTEVAIATEELQRIASSVATAKADEQARVTSLEQSRQALSQLEAKRDALGRDIEEREFLKSQIASASAKMTTRRAELNQQFESQRNAITVETRNCQNEQQRAEQAIATGQQELTRQRAVLEKRGVIVAAAGAVDVANTGLAEVDKAIEQAQQQLSNAAQDRATMQRLVAEKAALKSQGEAQAQVIIRLKETAALIEEVPCKGSGLQGQCKLLVNANDAARAIPLNEQQLGSKRQAYEQMKAQIIGLQVTLDGYKAIEASLEAMYAKRKIISRELSDATATSAMQPLLAEAERRVPIIEGDLVEQQRVRDAAISRGRELSNQIVVLAGESKQALAELESSHAREVGQYQDRLNNLVEPVTDAQITAAKESVEGANRAVQASRARQMALAEQQTVMVGKLEAARALAARSADIKQMAERCAEEIAFWKRLEKGLGNDGCVALSIDDAGPEIALICNNLLKECFGGRFVVRLDTQTEQGNGNLKETFEVTVFDSARGGEGKSLRDLSGGEQVLVNECLTRAIALYAAQSSQKGSYQTLFTDETDGALDLNAKRTFMAMKRAVLAQGGYEREYFISHTPELWELADHTIDVTTL